MASTTAASRPPARSVEPSLSLLKLFLELSPFMHVFVVSNILNHFVAVGQVCDDFGGGKFRLFLPV
jgi:hypothetical protein